MKSEQNVASRVGKTQEKRGEYNLWWCYVKSFPDPCVRYRHGDSMPFTKGNCLQEEKCHFKQRNSLSPSVVIISSSW